MSYVIEAASKLHEKQMAAATKGQDVLVGAVEKVVRLRDKAPAVPEALQGVTEPIQKLIEPVQKVVGDRTEVTNYLTKATRDWFSAQQQFQNQLFEAVSGQNESAPAPKAKARKSTAKKA